MSLCVTVTSRSNYGTNLNDTHNHLCYIMCIIGYDLSKCPYLVKNSFGTDWGADGYAWLPFDYVQDYGYNMWTFDLPA